MHGLPSVFHCCLHISEGEISPNCFPPVQCYVSFNGDGGGGRREKHGQTLQPRKASQLNVSQIQSGQVGKHQLRLWVGDKKKIHLNKQSSSLGVGGVQSN